MAGFSSPREDASPDLSLTAYLRPADATEGRVRYSGLQTRPLVSSYRKHTYVCHIKLLQGVVAEQPILAGDSRGIETPRGSSGNSSVVGDEVWFGGPGPPERVTSRASRSTTHHRYARSTRPQRLGCRSSAGGSSVRRPAASRDAPLVMRARGPARRTNLRPPQDAACCRKPASGVSRPPLSVSSQCGLPSNHAL